MKEQKETLRRFFQEVWNEGNEDAVDVYLAETYTIFHDPGDAWHGKTLDRDGFKERLRISRAPFPDQCFDIVEMVAEPNRVVASWFWKGTHKGDLPGFPATGKTISMSGLTIYNFKDGRITGHWQVTDRLGVFQQLTNQPGH